MKTTEFIKENENLVQDVQQMHEGQQNTMLREECYHIAVNAVAIHKLLSAMGEDSQLEAWATEYIALANDHLKSVKEFLEYQKMDQQGGMEEFSYEVAESKFEQGVSEDAVEEDLASFKNKAKKVATAGAIAALGATAMNPNNYSHKTPTKDQSVQMQKQFDKKQVKENASAGATGASSMAVTMETLGEKGAFSRRDVMNKLGNYSNKMTAPKVYKPSKSPKVKM